MTPVTAVRPDWDTVPAAVRAYVEERLRGRVAAAESCGAGYTPGLASRLTLADGRRAFVKGVPEGHPLAAVYADEARITAALPEGAPAPRVLWSASVHEVPGWSLLCLEDLSGGSPDLSPRSPDLPAVVEAIARMGDALTPSPIRDAPQISDVLAPVLCGWAQLAEHTPEDLDPWAARNAHRLAEIETGWRSAAIGNTLTHADLRPDNMMLRAPGEVVVIDWSYLHQGARWFDGASLIPQLILAGQAPAVAERAVSALPVRPSDEALTSFAAALAGYWERSSRDPAPPDVPYLRGYQARAAAAARAWVAHRTGWL